jgi:two-component system, NarL family, response regulator LiaR
MTIRLVLADDHVVLRQGLRALLEDESDMEVVGEADNGREAVDLVLQIQPDVLLIDLVMPEIDGVAATRIIHERSPITRVLVLSSWDEESALVASVRAGAIGFLRKTAPIGVIVRAIRAAARGEVQFSAAAAALLVREMREPSTPEHLTSRELEVLQLIAEGLANKEIAWKLRITEKTVKSHVSTILGKLGLQSRTQAAMYASRLGLLRTDPPRLAAPVEAHEARVLSIDGVRRLRSPGRVRHA